MTVFPFEVGKAFLENIGHPITVPKSHLPYGALEAEGLAQKNITIICPRGERFEDQLYRVRPGVCGGLRGLGSGLAITHQVDGQAFCKSASPRTCHFASMVSADKSAPQSHSIK